MSQLRVCILRQYFRLYSKTKGIVIVEITQVNGENVFQSGTAILY